MDPLAAGGRANKKLSVHYAATSVTVGHAFERRWRHREVQRSFWLIGRPAIATRKAYPNAVPLRDLFAARPLGHWLVLWEKLAGAILMTGLAGLTAFFLVAHVHNPFLVIFEGELREDPHDFLATLLLRQFPFFSTNRLITLEVVWCSWAVLLGAEAIGLVLKKAWGEWLVLIETAAFIPFEAFELHQRVTAFKGAAITINIAILVYLAWWQLRRLMRRSKAS